MKTVIVDTGPLVAFVNRRDRHHRWAKAELGSQRPPLHTCESVLSEVSFLLARSGIDARAPVQMVERGLLDASFRLDSEAPRIAELMGRYSDVPMSLADASLVRLSELHADCVVLTLDSDFHIYRRHGRRRIPTRSP